LAELDMNLPAFRAIGSWLRKRETWGLRETKGRPELMGVVELTTRLPTELLTFVSITTGNPFQATTKTEALEMLLMTAITTFGRTALGIW
jgi:hypothetical protein